MLLKLLVVSHRLPSYFLLARETPRSSGSKHRGALTRVAGLSGIMESSSSSVETEAAKPPGYRKMGPQSPVAAAQLQEQSIKILQDALDQMCSLYRMSEEAHQRERSQSQERVQVLTENEGRRIAGIEELKVKVAGLEGKLFGRQQPGATGRECRSAQKFSWIPCLHIELTPAL